MRSALAAAAQRRAGRSRSGSISAVPPAETSDDYLPELALIAASILYRSPLPSPAGRPVFILNAAAFPSALEIDYDTLLSYVLARLPGEDELLSGTEYEIVFFAGGQPEGPTSEKKPGPGMGWYLQAYHVLSRATRKKFQRLYIVHPRTWVRVLIGVFGTIVSPKFRRKIVHVNTLSSLAQHIPIEKLLIPPAAYLHDRKLSPDVALPDAVGHRAFGARHPLSKNIATGETRLPRILRETTNFILMPSNVGTEGIFRIPPHSVLAGVLKEAYDRGQQYIVWKEGIATFAQPDMDGVLVDEIRLEDAYGVHLAASLIKTWYRELRDPIFHESSYEELRQRYSDPTTQITPEDLVDFVLPTSKTSPLSPMSREILTRHLLPLLSLMASHESQNKMGVENLAICFSMALVCGSNQLEDAKMSSIVRRILEAAITTWPQLRDGLNIDIRAFETDLRAPADPRDYDDPPEDDFYHRPSEDGLSGSEEGHRIVLSDLDETPASQATEKDIERAPALPPRHKPQASPNSPLPGLDMTVPVKRKPAPPTPNLEQLPTTPNPPPYSTVFDADGLSIHVADSPATYTPVDGFGPSRRANWSHYDDEKKRGLISEPVEPKPVVNVPKRKAVSSEQSDDTATHTPVTPAHIAPENATMLARMAAQKAAANMAQRIEVHPPLPKPQSELPISPESITPQGDSAIRKTLAPTPPSWQQANIQSLAKPVLPPRHAHTVPVISRPANDTTPPGPGVPRPRVPSPGLLARMSTMEASSDSAAGMRKPSLRPGRLDVRKSSVEDLRRLYEERATTVQSLAQADAARRGSSPAV